MSGLHKTEIMSLLSSLRGQIKKATEEDLDSSASCTPFPSTSH